MRRYTVYRMDYRTGKKEAIGSILERREKKRRAGENFLDLLTEARRLFRQGHEGGIGITLDVPNEALAIRSMVLPRGIVTIPGGERGGGRIGGRVAQG